MRRIFSFKTLFVVVLAAGVAALVATAMAQKRRLAELSEDELRALLEGKLAGRMSEEQLVQLQDAIVRAVKGAPGAASNGDGVASGDEESEAPADSDATADAAAGSGDDPKPTTKVTVETADDTEE